MEPIAIKSKKRLLVLFVGLLWINILQSNAIAADVSIIAPTSGTAFSPGDDIVVEVAIVDGMTVDAMVLMAEDIGLQKLEGPPWRFELSIPEDARGTKNLLVNAQTQGAVTQSLPVAIAVASPDTPISLEPSLSSLTLEYPGDQETLNIDANFQDGRREDVTYSDESSLYSSDPNVVRVASPGVLLGVAPGTATIIARYRGVSTRVDAKVLGNLRGDLNGDGRVDQDDMKKLLRYAEAGGIEASGSLDERDFNGDGFITREDAAHLVGLCAPNSCSLPDEEAFAAPIDIRPDTAENPINLRSQGRIPVAVLGTERFFVRTFVDRSSISFGPGGAAPATPNGVYEDVNGDGLEDLMLHFPIQEVLFSESDSEVCLTARTPEGYLLRGCDNVTFVGR